MDQQESMTPLRSSPSSKSCVVLICTTDEGLSIAELILESLMATQPAVLIDNLSSNESSSVNHCQVFVPILNQQFDQARLCQEALEQARHQGKPIIPVISVKKWRPEGWLGLLIAGRTFFRIFDRETAEKPFFDSNRITDLRYEIKVTILSLTRLNPEFPPFIPASIFRQRVNQHQPLLNATKWKRKSLKKKSMN